MIDMNHYKEVNMLVHTACDYQSALIEYIMISNFVS